MSALRKSCPATSAAARATSRSSRRLDRRAICSRTDEEPDVTTSDNTYVGRPIPRTEDPRLLRGKGCFLDDLHRPEMLYAVVLRSQVAHGMLRGIDPSEALALPGVHAILSAADIEGDLGRIPIRIAPLAGTDPYRQPVIASGKVRYVGEPIAIVVADSQAVAEDAAGLIGISIDECDPVPNTAVGEN